MGGEVIVPVRFGYAKVEPQHMYGVIVPGELLDEVNKTANRICLMPKQHPCVVPNVRRVRVPLHETMGVGGHQDHFLIVVVCRSQRFATIKNHRFCDDVAVPIKVMVHSIASADDRAAAFGRYVVRVDYKPCAVVVFYLRSNRDEGNAGILKQDPCPIVIQIVACGRTNNI